MKSESRWIATARAGIERSIDPATVFASGGIAAARIENSVIDIDSGPNMPSRMDPDDSFRDGSTEIGWVIGLGVEAPLADAWTLRLGGSYLDFGRSTHYVNRSGDNRCGPGSAPAAVSLQYREQPRHRALGDHLPVWLVADIGTFSTPPRECFANPDHAPKGGARRGQSVQTRPKSMQAND